MTIITTTKTVVAAAEAAAAAAATATATTITTSQAPNSNLDRTISYSNRIVCGFSLVLQASTRLTPS